MGKAVIKIWLQENRKEIILAHTGKLPPYSWELMNVCQSLKGK
jgi:hypothetical protein